MHSCVDDRYILAKLQAPKGRDLAGLKYSYTAGLHRNVAQVVRQFSEEAPLILAELCVATTNKREAQEAIRDGEQVLKRKRYLHKQRPIPNDRYGKTTDSGPSVPVT